MPRMTKELCAENSQQASISTLRNAAAPVFAKEGFRNIAWAGVFGSFARGEQKDSSDVDVIVVWDPAHKVGWYPPNNIFWLDIAEELEKVWGREVDVIDIRRGRIRTYVDVEALLSSRTLHGSETNPHVVKARRDASEVLETGFTLYGDISIKIKGTRASITGKSFEVVPHLIIYRTIY